MRLLLSLLNHVLICKTFNEELSFSDIGTQSHQLIITTLTICLICSYQMELTSRQSLITLCQGITRDTIPWAINVTPRVGITSGTIPIWQMWGQIAKMTRGIIVTTPMKDQCATINSSRNLAMQDTTNLIQRGMDPRVVEMKTLICSQM